MFMERAKLYRNYSRVSVSGYQIKHALKCSGGMRDRDTHVWRHGDIRTETLIYCYTEWYSVVLSLCQKNVAFGQHLLTLH